MIPHFFFLPNPECKRKWSLLSQARGTLGSGWNLWQGNVAIPTLNDTKSVSTYWNAGWGTKWGAGGQLSQGKWGSLSLPSLLLISCRAKTNKQKSKERERRENRRKPQRGEKETRDNGPLSAFQLGWKLAYAGNTGMASELVCDKKQEIKNFPKPPNRCRCQYPKWWQHWCSRACGWILGSWLKLDINWWVVTSPCS